MRESILMKFPDMIVKKCKLEGLAQSFWHFLERIGLFETSHGSLPVQLPSDLEIGTHDGSRRHARGAWYMPVPGSGMTMPE